jgi:hypothetical protein
MQGLPLLFPQVERIEAVVEAAEFSQIIRWTDKQAQRHELAVPYTMTEEEAARLLFTTLRMQYGYSSERQEGRSP